MEVLLIVGFFLMQAPGAVDVSKLISASDQKLLHEVAANSGFTRTWIPYRSASPVQPQKPDATYRTTLALGATVKDHQLVDAEVRRFGTMLLGYRLDSTGKPATTPNWVGLDSAGPSASVLDRFYVSVAAGDLMAARTAGATFVPSDLDVASRLAALELRRGNTAEADKVISSIRDKSSMSAGLSEVVQRHLKEDTDFFAVEAIRLIIAQRQLVAASVK